MAGSVKTNVDMTRVIHIAEAPSEWKSEKRVSYFVGPDPTPQACPVGAISSSILI